MKGKCFLGTLSFLSVDFYKNEKTLPSKYSNAFLVHILCKQT